MLLEHHTRGIFKLPYSCTHHLLGLLTSQPVTETRMQCLLYLQSRKMLMPVSGTVNIVSISSLIFGIMTFRFL